MCQNLRLPRNPCTKINLTNANQDQHDSIRSPTPTAINRAATWNTVNSEPKFDDAWTLRLLGRPEIRERVRISLPPARLQVESQRTLLNLREWTGLRLTLTRGVVLSKLRAPETRANENPTARTVCGGEKGEKGCGGVEVGWSGEDEGRKGGGARARMPLPREAEADGNHCRNEPAGRIHESRRGRGSSRVQARRCTRGKGKGAGGEGGESAESACRDRKDGTAGIRRRAANAGVKVRVGIGEGDSGGRTFFTHKSVPRIVRQALCGGVRGNDEGGKRGECGWTDAARESKIQDAE
ncbi:hypothetical protein B0H16DRAFT_1694123 [Mycena metata]|uniref:Uncharacterized protein n=1 Tax=Mycena metata TaxID=1033252 RepID=A0AAD7N153_9AGAR|nr:hypothetical protein B0H16DRAFT_1694123 [Mycena metata]